MKLKVTWIACAALAVVVVAVGCRKETPAEPAGTGAVQIEEPESAAGAEEAVVETMEHYRQKAAEEIDEENAEEELARLTKEIESELGE